MRFLKAVEKAPPHKTLEVCSRNWELFDAELAAACFRFASGEVLRRLKMYRDTLQRRGLDVSGRAALWFVFQKHAVEAGALQQVGLSRLIGLTFSGELGLFLDSLDKNLDGAGGACLGGLGIDNRGPTAPRSFQDKDVPLISC